MKTSPCDWLDSYLDGDLSAPDQVCFESHLHSCSDCRESVNEWHATSAFLKQASEQLELLSDRLRRRVAQNLVSHRRADSGARSRHLVVATSAGLAALAALFVFCLQIPSTPVRLVQRDATSDQLPARNDTHRDVVLSFPDNVIGVPVDIGEPDVIVVWAYPTVRTTAEQD